MKAAGVHGVARPAGCSARSWAIPVMIALIMHSVSLFGDFVYDDVPLIAEHPELGTTGFALRIWTRDYGLEFLRRSVGFYRPLFMTLVFAVHAVAGATPFYFHAVSLLLFCVATALVARLTAAAFPNSRYAPLVAGCLYAVHPARVEVVSLFMSLPDLLVETAALAAVCLLDKNRRLMGSVPSLRHIAALFLLSAAAALTKESAFFIFTALAGTVALNGCLHAGHRRDWLASTVLAATLLAGLLTAYLARMAADIQASLSLSAVVHRFVEHDAAYPALLSLGFAVKELVVPGAVVFWRSMPEGEAVGGGLFFLILPLIILLLFWGGSLAKSRFTLALLLAWIGANVFNLMLLSAMAPAYSQRYLAIAPAVIVLCAGGDYLVKRFSSRLSVSARSIRLPLTIALSVWLALHAVHTLSGAVTALSPLPFFMAMHSANPGEVVPLGAVAETLNKEHASVALIDALVREATTYDVTHQQIPLLHNMVIKRYLDERAYAECLVFSEWSLSLFSNDMAKVALRSVALAETGRHAEALSEINRAICRQPDVRAYHLLRDQIMNNAPEGQEER